ncbi:MAG: hypothetical protein ACJAVK_001346 [Akkermansiaceae bacterium]|jgi:hypothetical protein
MKHISLICSLALVMPGFGNEALKLLDQESDSAQNVFEQAARLPTSRKALDLKKEKLEEPNLRFPTRWRTELAPKFPFEVEAHTTVAPRGLFEYQSQDRSAAKGAKLSRARLGVAIQTYYGIALLADALLASSGEYEGWETLRASVPIGEQMRLSAGKFPPPFSTEYSRDAAVRWFATLSPLAAQLAPASSLGAMIEGRGESLDWKLGWFGSDSDRSMPSLEGDGYLLASIATAKNRGGVEGAPEASYQRWHLDYIYNRDGSDSESIAQGYRHLLSAGTEYSSGRFDFYTEFLAARGAANTAYGITAAGRYWLLQDAVSVVGRYQYATSRHPGGIFSYWGVPDTGSDALFPTDFQAVTVASQLSSIFGGVNVHFDDDNFIIGTGVEYRSLSGVGEDDESFGSWGWNTFARYAF